MQMMNSLVLFFILVFSQFNSVQAERTCMSTHYYSKQMNKCLACKATCMSPGYEIAKNCGYNDKGDKIGPSCSQCKSGYYSFKKYNDENVQECTRCSKCEVRNQKFTRNCSAAKDAECGGCIPGYYKGLFDMCHKCSPCCSMDQTHSHSECFASGLGRACSCSSHPCMYEGSAKHSCNATQPTTGVAVQTTSKRTSKKATTLLVTTNPLRKHTKSFTSRIFTAVKIRNTAGPSKAAKIRSITVPNKAMVLQNQSTTSTPWTKPQNRSLYNATSARPLNDERHPRPPTIEIDSQINDPTTAPPTKSWSVTKFHLQIKTATIFQPKNAAKNIIGSNDGSVDASSNSKSTNWKSKIGFIAFFGVAFLMLIAGLVVYCICSKKETPKFPDSPRSTISTSNDSKCLREINCSTIPARGSKSDSKCLSVITSISDGDVCEHSHGRETSFFHDVYTHLLPKESVNKAEPFYLDEDEPVRREANLEDDDYLSLPNSKAYVSNPELKGKGKSESFPETTVLPSEQSSKKVHHSMQGCQITKTCGKCTFSKDNKCAKLLEDLKSCQKKQLQKYLDVENAVANWKEIAVYFKIDEKEIDIWDTMLRAGHSPTRKVLCHLKSKRHTVGELVLCLQTIGREEVKKHFLSHLQDGCSVCNRNYVPPIDN